jgi:hypothetical protein
MVENRPFDVSQRNGSGVEGLDLLPSLSKGFPVETANHKPSMGLPVAVTLPFDFTSLSSSVDFLLLRTNIWLTAFAYANLFISF